MKKIIGWGIVVALIVGGGVIYWNKKKAAERRAHSSSVVVAKQGAIEETVDTTGEVAPLNRVEIKPPISGRIEKLLVDEGAHVKAGDILAWMSSSDRAAILDAARAQGADAVKHWEDSYKATPIVAPLSGIVILRNVVVGQTVDASAVLFAMSDKLIVVAQVDETDIGRVRNGMKARITLDAYPDTVVEGKVFQILHEGKNVSNVITYDVKIEPNRVPDFYRSQMTANVSLVLRREEDAILLPTAVIHESRSGGKQVMVPGPDGKPTSRDVEVGIQSGETTQVVSGIDAGEKVVMSQSRYVPQKGPQSSPLSFGGPGGGRRSSSGTGGGGRGASRN